MSEGSNGCPCLRRNRRPALRADVFVLAGLLRDLPLTVNGTLVVTFGTEQHCFPTSVRLMGVSLTSVHNSLSSVLQTLMTVRSNRS